MLENKGNQAEELKKNMNLGAKESNPYQPNKASLEHSLPPKRNLLVLAKHFFWIYIAIFGVSSVIIAMLTILSAGALFMVSVWLLIFALFIVPYMAYRLCLDKFPENDIDQSLRGKFIITVIVFSIIIHLSLSFLVLILCASTFY